MPKRTLHSTWLVIALIILWGCNDRGLRLDAQGRVSYGWAAPGSVDPNPTNGQFSHENGCIVFTRYDGKRFLPILTEGRLYVVEPMQILFDGHWTVGGFDETNDTVKSLQNDPVAVKCNAVPALITDIRPQGLFPPVPPALLGPPSLGSEKDLRSAPTKSINEESRQAARQTLQRYFAVVQASRTDDAAKLWNDRRRGAEFTEKLYRFGAFQPNIAAPISSNSISNSAQLEISLQLLRKTSSGDVPLSDGNAVLQRAVEHPNPSSDFVTWRIDQISLQPPPVPLGN